MLLLARFMALGNVKRALLGRYDFEGHYKSFAEISNPTTHDDVAFAGAAVEARLRNWPGPYALDILPIVLAGFRDCTVVDVGGGACTGLSQIATSLVSPIRLRYVLVETPAMCKTVRFKLLPHIGIDADCTAIMPKEVKRPCIINVASVLQYIDNWRDCLIDFTLLKPEAIIISNTPVWAMQLSFPTYARVQINGKGRRIPAWCFDRDEIERNLPGYKLTYYIEERQHLRHKHAPGLSVQASMIFHPA